MEIKENDVLLWGKERDQGGIIRFFLVRNNKLFLYATPLELRDKTEATRTFSLQGCKSILPMGLATGTMSPDVAKL